jgi:hypothetical protein
LIANQAGHVFAVKQHAVVLFGWLQLDRGFGGKTFQPRAVVQRDTCSKRLEGKSSVHGAAFKVEQAKMSRKMAGDCTLARAGRAVNGDDDFAGRSNASQKAFFRTHARFFFSCSDWGFGRAVKPYRLLLPALAPAVKAGFRLLRTGLESVRA